MKIFSTIRLPFFVILIAISTLIACSFGNLSIFGFTLKGYAWVIQFALAGLLLCRKPSNISFPWYIWSPWILLVLLYFLFWSYENALQRSIMLLCPIVVGVTTSRYSIREAELKQFIKLCEYLTIAFYVIVALKSGLLLTGTLPEATGLAAEAMTGALLATLFAARYVYEKKRTLYYWIGLSIIPIIALTRTAIAATALTLPTTFAPLTLRRRIIIFSLIAAIGIGIFYTERFQRKMFYSGKGTVADLRLDNPDLFASGRLWLWEVMEEEIIQKPWLGYGANANENFLFGVVGFSTHPHNDWIRLRFDYGYVGTFVFGFCVFLQIFHAWKRARITTGETRVLFYAAASSFLPFILFMLTDNIILYATFFGNLQFIVLGLAYASLKTAQIDTKHLQRIKSYPAITSRLYFKNGPNR